MKRVGALVGAVAMVVAALVVRGTFSGDAGGAGQASAGTGLVCPIELADPCGAVEATATATMGAIVDTLVAVEDLDQLDADTWLMPAPWAGLLVAERARLGRDPMFLIDVDPIATSPVVLAVWSGRARELEARCERPVDWGCLAEQADRTLDSGDRVRIGVPHIDTATGLAVAGAQAGSLLGTSDFAANDFTATFTAAARPFANGQQADPLATMRSRGPGQLTAVGVVAADAGTLDSTFGSIDVLTELTPAARVDLVIVTVGDATVDDETSERLQTALEDAGWGPGERGDDGLPAGGVLAAIRTLWADL